MILHLGTVRELAPLLLAVILAGAAAAALDGMSGRRTGSARFAWGRSVGVRLLPFFIILGMARGYCEARTVRAEQELALNVECDWAAGEICSVSSKENWTVLVLKRVETRAGTLRFLQVYAKPENGTGCRIGQTVQVRGSFSQFQPASVPGEFDYAAYYRGEKLVWRVFADAVDAGFSTGSGGKTEEAAAGQSGEPAGPGIWKTAGNRVVYCLLNGIWKFRGLAVERLRILAGEEDGSLFAAMLLGDKSGLPEEIRDLYQKNGIAHLLAVSGLHLSLVSVAVYGALRKAGAGYGSAAVAGGTVLVLYSILTGASASVLRALTMTLCGFLAAYLGRTYDLLSAMGLSALLLLWNSPYCIDQAGVQLSFAAIGGIGAAKELEACRIRRECQAVGPEAQRIHSGAEPGQKLSVWDQTLYLTICMQLVSLPIVLWHFFSYPLYGIFLNLLVVPLAGVVVGSGAGGLLAGAIWQQAGAFLMGAGRAVLAWYALCCRWCGRLPGSSMLRGRPELCQIVLYYAFLILLFWFVSRRRKEMLLIPALMAGLLFLRAPKVHGLEVSVLDTGQGDGICIRTRDRVILVDGGSSDQKELGKYRLEPFLKSRGIRQIDLAVVSHADWDHISGLAWLLEQEDAVWVRGLAMPEAGRGEDAYENLAELCEAQGGTVLWCSRGDMLEGAEEQAGRRGAKPQLSVLYPDCNTFSALSPVADRNEHSLVLQLDYGVFHMLLTGDMSGEGEQGLLELAGKTEDSLFSPGSFRLLKAAHHGSGYSSSEAFLEWLEPEYTVISCGANNRYGHPHPNTLERLRRCGSEILQTTESGTLIWNTDGKRVRVKEYKTGEKHRIRE